MPIQCNITAIVGTPPFNIWGCDFEGNNNTCVYINTTSSVTFDFVLPEEFETASGYCVKIIDAESCEDYVCFGDSA